MWFICLMTLNLFTLFFSLLHFSFNLVFMFFHKFLFLFPSSFSFFVSYSPPPQKKTLISLLFSSHQPFISFPTWWWLIDASTSSPSPNLAIIFSIKPNNIKFLFPYLLSFTPSVEWLLMFPTSLFPIPLLKCHINTNDSLK